MDVALDPEGTGVPTCLGSVERIDLVHLEAHAHHGVLLLPWAILDVRGGDDGAVGQQLHPRVAAITASIAVQELDAVLAGPSLANIVVGAHPGHEMAACWAIGGLVPEGDDQSTVWRIDAHVTVTGESPRRVHRFAPGLRFVPAEHHQAVAFVRILAYQAFVLDSIWK